jgi:ligand-binding sensor domain-containing protein/signal transduction histidine kinase/CheY-like chemotaxis protein/AraC-like DNA-binding protein
MNNLTAILFLLVACLQLFSAPAKAQRYHFTNINAQKGLSENRVRTIVQDHWGLMWLGTKNGLNRFDGNNIKTFSVVDALKHHGNNNVSALFEDSRHCLWVGTDKGVFVFNPYTEAFTFFDTKTSKGKGITNWIADIKEDYQGNIWIVSPLEGLFKYNFKSKSLSVYHLTSPNAKYSSEPQCVCVRRNGEVWIGTNGSGIYRYEPRTNRFVNFHTSASGTSLLGQLIFTLCDYGNWIAIAEHEGRLMKFNPKTRDLQLVKASRVHYQILRALAFDGHRLIAGTQDGLFFINEHKGEEEQILSDSFQPYSLSDNMIESLCLDRTGGLWVGTMHNGVNYLPQHGLVFSNIIPLPGKKSIRSRSLHDLITDIEGKAWIGSEEGYLDVYDPRTRQIVNVQSPIYRGGSNRLALLSMGNTVWSGIFKNGLDIVDIHTYQLRHYTPEELGLRGEGSVYALYRDSKGRVWLGTASALYLMTSPMHFTQVKGLPTLFTQDIVEDRKGRIWIATMGDGLFCYNPETRSYKRFVVTGKPHSILSNSVSSISVDHQGKFWLATDRGGISHFDPLTGQAVNYSKQEGLPDDVTYKSLEDQWGNQWFGTNHGIVRLNPHDGSVHVFRNLNENLGNQYNYKSATIMGNGEFAIGGLDGLVIFDPRNFAERKGKSRVFITDLQVNGKDILPEENGILTENILHSQRIRLPYSFSTVAFSLSSLNYSGTEYDRYVYKLEGIDKEWLTTDKSSKISYSRLPSGDYVLKVRLADANSPITQLKIHVNYPWWNTQLARVIYGVLILALVAGLLYYFFRRQERNFRRRERQLERAKEEEVMRAKINFFTDITHEIRSPLTLINGALENICDLKIKNHNLARNIKAISTSSKRLLNLANQLLDLRKSDAKVVELTFMNMDICVLMRNLIESFVPAAQRQGKKLTFRTSQPSIILPIDKEAVTKIASNLLNNALKYSSSFIRVFVNLLEDHLEIVTENDGDKIPVDKAEEVFKPFVQLNSDNPVGGTGIGLALARSLAELHHGSLHIDTSASCNRFVLTLPLTQEHVIQLNEAREATAQAIDNAIEEEAEETEEVTDVKSLEKSSGIVTKEYTILVVDDNDEILQLITEKLQPFYTVIIACNGQDALEKLRTNFVDLVITDIMMPVMDGVQLTKAIREDEKLKHIPVVVLTAKHSMSSNLDSMKAGADAYVTKPFSVKFLIQTVATVIANRKKDLESYMKNPYIPLSSQEVHAATNGFLQHVQDVVLEHLSDSEFTIDNLASELGMSRSNLHRKLTAATGMPPSEYVRIIRLKKAAELMLKNDLRSSEVAACVGFGSISYFSKCFTKQFGVSPKKFMQQKHR